MLPTTTTCGSRPHGRGAGPRSGGPPPTCRPRRGSVTTAPAAEAGGVLGHGGVPATATTSRKHERRRRTQRRGVTSARLVRYSGKKPDRSARSPLARTRPAATASRPSDVPPVASHSQVIGVGLDDVGRRAPGVPRAPDALHRAVRRHAHLDGATRRPGGQLLEQDSAPRRAGRPAAEGCAASARVSAARPASGSVRRRGPARPSRYPAAANTSGANSIVKCRAATYREGNVPGFPIPARSSMHSLWRIRSYVRPYLGQMLLMTSAAARGRRGQHRHPADHPDGRRRPDRRRRPRRAAPARPARPGCSASLEAGLVFIRRWVQSYAALGMETDDPRRPLRAPAAAAGRVPRPLAVRPAAVPGDHRPVDDPPVPVLRPGLPGRQHRHLRRGGRPARSPLLRRSALLVAAVRGAAVAASRATCSRALPRRCRGGCRTSRATSRPSSRSRPSASGSSGRSAGATTSAARFRSERPRRCTTPRSARPRWWRASGRCSTWSRASPSALVLLFGARRGRPQDAMTPRRPGRVRVADAHAASGRSTRSAGSSPTARRR